MLNNKIIDGFIGLVHGPGRSILPELAIHDPYSWEGVHSSQSISKYPSDRYSIINSLTDHSLSPTIYVRSHVYHRQRTILASKLIDAFEALVHLPLSPRASAS